MSETRLQAESRTEFGKGAARRIRREHKVPAVLYGHGTDPVHVTLPGHDTMLALKHGGANALLSIELGGKTQLVLPKQVQRHPVRGELEHLDLLIVKRGEKVTVDVPIVTTGEAAAETVVTVEHSTISVQAEATHLPESIEVSVEGAEAGTQILAKDLVLPQGTVLQVDEEQLVVNITAAVELDLEPEIEAEEGAEGEEAEAAEGAEADEAGEGGESQGGGSDEASGDQSDE
jgi:large subunit ribosomal protein L25